MKEKIVLAYSGGVDTSVAIKWLADKFNIDVVTLTIDVGNVPNLEEIRKKAVRVGAKKAVVMDAKELFVKQYVFPALQADAIYEGQYTLAHALARPLIT